jgi:hypothetical protein
LGPKHVAINDDIKLDIIERPVKGEQMQGICAAMNHLVEKLQKYVLGGMKLNCIRTTTEAVME